MDHTKLTVPSGNHVMLMFAMAECSKDITDMLPPLSILIWLVAGVQVTWLMASQLAAHQMPEPAQMLHTLTASSLFLEHFS